MRYANLGLWTGVCVAMFMGCETGAGVRYVATQDAVGAADSSEPLERYKELSPALWAEPSTGGFDPLLSSDAGAGGSQLNFDVTEPTGFEQPDITDRPDVAYLVEIDISVPDDDAQSAPEPDTAQPAPQPDTAQPAPQPDTAQPAPQPDTAQPIPASDAADPEPKPQAKPDPCVPDNAPPSWVAKPALQLWPPNHKYTAITLQGCADVYDACDGKLDISTSAKITKVTSDEPEDAVATANANSDKKAGGTPNSGKLGPDSFGGGDGATLNDIIIVDNQTVMVRKERDGGRNGRVYTIYFTVADAAGNTTQGVCIAGVPHDQGTGSTPIADPVEYTVTP